MVGDSYHGETIGSRTWFRMAVVRAGEDIAVLVQDLTERKEAEEQIRQQMAELQQFNQLMVGCELRMLALENEINALCVWLGRPADDLAEFLQKETAAANPDLRHQPGKERP